MKEAFYEWRDAANKFAGIITDEIMNKDSKYSRHKLAAIVMGIGALGNVVAEYLGIEIEEEKDEI